MKFTPFYIAGVSSNHGEAFIIENDTRTVCWTSNSTNANGPFVSDEDRELAKFIVTACNTHHTLVSLVERALEYAASIDKDGKDRDGLKLVMAMRDALKEVEDGG